MGKQEDIVGKQLTATITTTTTTGTTQETVYVGETKGSDDGAMAGSGWRQLNDDDTKRGPSDEVAIEMEQAPSRTEDADKATPAPLDGVRHASARTGAIRTTTAGEYKVYKRRWFGLVQLTLLNIIVSWDVSRSLFSLRN